MLGLVRTAISLFFVAALVWCSFTVPLGDRPLADHVDRIGETPEARDLMTGTRERIQPLLDELKHRLLGEHVEAPTYAVEAEPPRPPAPPALPAADPHLARGSGVRAPAVSPRRTPAAATRAPSTPESPRLPGARRATSLPSAHLAHP